MRWFPAALISSVCLFAVGCVSPPPISRGAAAGIADNVQRAHSFDWGDPVEVIAPGISDAHGQRWWQLRYAGVPPRLILVDADTGWGRLPPADYVPRSRPQPSQQIAVATKNAASPVPMLVEGSFIYCLTAPVAGDDAAVALLEREAARLNALAASTDLYPQFSVRTDRSGRSALIYGWQGTSGIARDEHVAEWVQVRTTFGASAQWSDLLPR